MKKIKKSFQQRLVKGTKIFLKKKKEKHYQYVCQRYGNLSEEEKQNQRQYGCE